MTQVLLRSFEMRNAVFILMFACAQIALADAVAKRVVVISLDGLRPDFLTSSKYKTPNLRKLLKESAASLSLEPVNPTLTYPNHTSMVTGVSSSVHGIYSNTLFNSEKGTSTHWYWNADLIRVPTVWGEAVRLGKSVSILRWPVTAGAKVKWGIPEIFTIPEIKKTDTEVIQSATDSKVIAELESGVGSQMPTEDLFVPLDAWTTRAALYLEKKHKPDLQLIHISNVDHIQHVTGLYSPETTSAIERVDGLMGEFVELKKDPRVCLIVLGDHGHSDYTEVLRINVLLQKNGWIELNSKKEITSYRAIAHASGSQAEIYVKDPKDVAAVMNLLKTKGSKYLEFISSDELKKMKLHPNAAFAVAAKIGYSLSGSFSDEEVEHLGFPQSTHGYLSTEKQMNTVFMASGCGIKPKTLGKLKMQQVAPTLSKILKLNMHGFEYSEIKL